MKTQKKYMVTLRRANGRFVKEATRPSRYAAKKLAWSWEAKHPEMYAEINPVADG